MIPDPFGDLIENALLDVERHEQRIRDIADRFMDRYDRTFRELADT